MSPVRVYPLLFPGHLSLSAAWLKASLLIMAGSLVFKWQRLHALALSAALAATHMMEFAGMLWMFELAPGPGPQL